MDKLLYISTSGASENLNALAVRANNLANANTNGFKADLEQARSMQVFGEGLPTRVFAMTESPRADFTPGPINITERNLDLAIKGKGFFAVFDKNRQEAYTRNGSLQVNIRGFLANERGNEMKSNTGAPIFIPRPVKSLDISEEGQVSYVPVGGGAADRVIAGQLKFVNPQISNLMKGEDGMFRLKNPAQPFMPVNERDYNDIRLEIGALEGSNVSAAKELVSLISLQRQFEMQVKMIRTAEEIEQSGSQLMKLG